MDVFSIRTESYDKRMNIGISKKNGIKINPTAHLHYKISDKTRQ